MTDPNERTSSTRTSESPPDEDEDSTGRDQTNGAVEEDQLSPGAKIARGEPPVEPNEPG